MEAEFLDCISGQHETDSTLDAYLNPNKFHFENKKGYSLFAHGALKLFIVPEDIIAESSPMTHISNKLRSHYKTTPMSIESGSLFVKTQDLETTGGCIFMVHEAGYVLQKDLEFLRSVERYAFQLVLSEGSDNRDNLNDVPTPEDIKSFANEVALYGSTLFVSDNIFDNLDMFQVSPEDIDSVKGKYDCVVVKLNKSLINKRADDAAYLFLRIIDKVKLGGLIFVPKSTYIHAPNGRLGVEALIKVLNLELELPMHNHPKMVLASKRMN